jgi:hypothetical protein
MPLRTAVTMVTSLSVLLATRAIAAPLQPTGAWTVDYGDTQCTAAHSFGPSADPVVLGIIPSINGKTYRIIVSLQRNGPIFAHEAHGAVDFGRGKIRSWLLYYGRSGLKLTNYEFRISGSEIEQARSATRLGLSTDKGGEYEFALYDMAQVLDALSKCTADLQQFWNMDEKRLVPVAKNAKGDLRMVFDSSDYPSEAVARGQEGKSQYQLLIDEKGSVAGCDVLIQSGVPIIDVMGCQVMKERAKFRPSTDSNGKPIRSVLTTPPVVWSLRP